jgi:hypothetical protein
MLAARSCPTVKLKRRRPNGRTVGRSDGRTAGPNPRPKILRRLAIRERLGVRDHVAQIRERRVARPARREMRFERRALGRVELAVDVFRKPVHPSVVHRSKCLRSAIRA